MTRFLRIILFLLCLLFPSRIAQAQNMEAVDLGLSVNWASCNLGASCPEGKGNYYAWGDTKENRYPFMWNNYIFWNGSYMLKYRGTTLGDKYVNHFSIYVDSNGKLFVKTDYERLLNHDDAAFVATDGEWRMPTLEEWKELFAHTDKDITTENGVRGMRFYGRGRGDDVLNSIFIPFEYDDVFDLWTPNYPQECFDKKNKKAPDYQDVCYRYANAVYGGLLSEVVIRSYEKCWGLQIRPVQERWRARTIKEGEIPPEGLKGSIVFNNGDKYMGYFKNGKMEDRNGVMRYANGDIYEGPFVQGRIEGKGEKTYADGGKYEGSFVDGKREGYGSYYNKDGYHKRYKGDFHNDKMHGHGELWLREDKEDASVIYVGEFRDGYRNGEGKLTIGGCAYSGTFVNDKLEGQATVTAPMGRFEGMLSKDDRDKYGIKTLPGGKYGDGDIFGHGIFYSNNGDKYEGDFFGGPSNFLGVLTKTNGTKWVGTFKNGLFDGHGKTVFPNGDSVSGEWKEGKAAANLKYSGEGVDMGVSVRWAQVNLDAEDVTDYGGSYAWGETESRKDFGMRNYRLGVVNKNYKIKFTKYNSSKTKLKGKPDNKLKMDPEDDAATQKWGDGWRIPTAAEWEELMANCTLLKVTINEVVCVKVQSNITGNCIYIPTNPSALVTNKYNAEFWSSDLESLKDIEVAKTMWVNTRYDGSVFSAKLSTTWRYVACSIRPVRAK